MIVSITPYGRLGNGSFTYAAASLFCLLYNGTLCKQSEIQNFENRKHVIITDAIFDNFGNLFGDMEKTKDECIVAGREYIEKHTNSIMSETFYVFHANCLHWVLFHFRIELYKWFEQHLDDEIYSKYDTPEYKIFYTRQLLYIPENIKQYDYVIHLRLEDFVKIYSPSIDNPKILVELFDNIEINANSTVAIVCNEPVSDFEKKYVNYVKKGLTRYFNLPNIFTEHNDILTDFHIMRNATNVICSQSTLCWFACFLSYKENDCKYFYPSNRWSPNYYVLIADNIYNINNQLLFTNQVEQML
jgi:hypothetical protein